MLLASGVGSLIAQEVGKLAMEHTPIVKQVATDTAVNIAKKSFDLFLDHNPNFSNFLGHFNIGKFNPSVNHKTFTNRGRKRRITYHNH